MYYKAILNYRRGNTAAGETFAFRTRHYREMGFSEKEFTSCLPFAVAGKLDSSADEPGSYRVTSAGSDVRIRTRRLPSRRLGSLSLPVLGVDIEYHGGSESDYADFMRRFDRHFLRMGG